VPAGDGAGVWVALVPLVPFVALLGGGVVVGGGVDVVVRAGGGHI
jgi:hypothetical protein